MMHIILGSSSPRRKYILGSICSTFEIIVPDADESVLDGENASDYAARVSRLKADNIVEKMDSARMPFLIITCDTIVALDGAIIGKPRDDEHAVDMLSSLSGRTHEVISSITLTTGCGEQQTIITAAEYTRVTFKPIDLPAIKHYLSRIHFLDKAGSYALQEHGGLIIERVEGSQTNVIGFPLRLFFSMISDLNLTEKIF